MRDVLRGRHNIWHVCGWGGHRVKHGPKSQIITIIDVWCWSEAAPKAQWVPPIVQRRRDDNYMIFESELKGKRCLK